MTFYLKYRPQKIEDLDIVSVRERLKKIVSSNSLPHAFLFSGPKGTGKTSTARILAKYINCENKNACGSCEQCLTIASSSNIDVVEMDAASNRGIDDIRSLKDAVKLYPAKAKARVYIIDEAHMLTVEAFNALLKTLEEPPEHVYFILATTNPEKIIDTIKSRTTTIDFPKASRQETVAVLEKIAKSEKIDIKSEDLDKIYTLSEGSFRDAVKTLEQYSLDATYLQKYMASGFENLVNLILDKEEEKVFLEINKLKESNTPQEYLVKQVLSVLENLLTQSSDLQRRINASKLISLILKYHEYQKISPIEYLTLEVAIFEWLNNKARIASDDPEGSGESSDDTSEPQKEKVLKAKKKDDSKDVAENAKILQNKRSEHAGDLQRIKIDGNFSLPEWGSVLTTVKPQNASLEALLRLAKPISMESGKVKLGVYYKFHKDKLEEMKNKVIVENAISKVFKLNQVSVEFCLAEANENMQLIEPKSDDIVSQENITKLAEEIFS